ncbi:hypothetical protein C8R45DRAFT_1219852 [Mycena sanguinolenta]|nr:hypothetical protein C8R45DRAFT_1219852 [Mycena sanguinolenta]
MQLGAADLITISTTRAYFEKRATQPHFPSDRGHHSPIFASSSESHHPDTLAKLVPIAGAAQNVSEDDQYEQAVNAVAKERGHKNRDVINVSREGMGSVYEEKIRGFFASSPRATTTASHPIPGPRIR